MQQREKGIFAAWFVSINQRTHHLFITEEKMNLRRIKTWMILLGLVSLAMLPEVKEPLAPGGGVGSASIDTKRLIREASELDPGHSTTAMLLGGKFCFQSYRDSNWEIYTMHADGSSQTNLTNNSATDWTCRWSPDGKQIVFTSKRDGAKEQIYVMNADGSQQTRLTTNTFNDTYPSWSPDGSQIVFSSDRDGDFEIYVMNRDGSDVKQLTDNTDWDSHPSWSTNGTFIAFSSDRDGNFEIYKMKHNGSAQTRITSNAGLDWYPNWSPNNGWIAIYSSGEVWKMKPDGTTLTQLTNTSGDNWSPVYSYNSKYIAFSSNRDTNEEVYVMNSNGSEQTNLTNNPANDRYPHWNAFYWQYLPVVSRD
jgi:Tol biopolymer transport system component